MNASSYRMPVPEALVLDLRSSDVALPRTHSIPTVAFLLTGLLYSFGIGLLGVSLASWLFPLAVLPWLANRQTRQYLISLPFGWSEAFVLGLVGAAWLSALHATQSPTPMIRAAKVAFWALELVVVARILTVGGLRATVYRCTRVAVLALAGWVIVLRAVGAESLGLWTQNGLGLIFSVSAVIVFNRSRNAARPQWLHPGCVLLFLTGCLFLGSRGSWVAVAFVCLLFGGYVRWVVGALAVAAAVGYVALLPLLPDWVEWRARRAVEIAREGTATFENRYDFRRMPEDQESIAARLLMWEKAYGLFRESPWLGVGPGELAMSEPPKGWMLSEDFIGRGPHSGWMQLLGELGIVGVSAYGSLCACFLLGLWRARRRGWAPDDVTVPMGMLVGLWTHMIVLASFYGTCSWMVYAFPFSVVISSRLPPVPLRSAPAPQQAAEHGCSSSPDRGALSSNRPSVQQQ